jgi:hypothetical protein
VERKWWTLLASCIAIFMLLLANHTTDVFLRDRRHGVTELISVAARQR